MLIIGTILGLRASRARVESVVRLPESSIRARTEDNGRDCTIPCRHCRWALSGTDKMASSGKTAGDWRNDEICNRSRAARFICVGSLRNGKRKWNQRERENARSEATRSDFASPSKGPCFRPIVSWISSALTLRVTSRSAGDYSPPPSPPLPPLSLSLSFCVSSATTERFDSTAFNNPIIRLAFYSRWTLIMFITLVYSLSVNKCFPINRDYDYDLRVWNRLMMINANYKLVISNYIYIYIYILRAWFTRSLHN